MKVKIETLTPIHIGSGNTLNYNTDFYTVATSTGGRFVRVVDERKVLDLIGVEHVQDWVLSIERGQSIKELLKTYAPNAKPADYSCRRMTLFDPVSEGDTLKECIHNGMGLPYIPGGSIKGALRTAITATLASKQENLENKVWDKKGNLSGSELERILFGADPNHDIFRFLHCGDAYFSSGKEIVFRMEMGLNITHNDSLVPTRDKKPQLIEAIGSDAVAEFQMKINSDYYHWVKAQKPNEVGEMPSELESFSSLFGLVNNHTLSLLEYELKFWEGQTKSGADYYLERLNDMATVVKECINNGNNSCVLRLGHAIGWNFITGGWSRKLSDFDEMVVPSARPHNKKYEEYPFPKSRCLDSEGEMIGFVKLSI